MVDQVFILKQIGKKAHEKKQMIYAWFIYLEKASDSINREALYQELRMYDVGGKLWNTIKS